MTDFVTRFAPSPNGFLHLGHAFSALSAYRAAMDAGGRFLLRIEDIDTGRARPEFEAAIYDDLKWLGLEWEQPVRRQSDHFEDYTKAIASLSDRGLTYPCFCTRRDILTAGVEMGPDGPIYPGICRHLSAGEVVELIEEGQGFALRLRMDAAMEVIAHPLTWFERSSSEIAADPLSLGDVLLARKDIGTSYHISVVVDDALQGVTQIIRGRDLFEATPIHRLLQELLGLPEPHYHHHRLIEDDTGIRLAKSKGSPSLKDLREQGIKLATVIDALGLK